MYKKIPIILLTSLFFLCFNNATFAKNVPVKNFKLLDHQGKIHELHYYSDKKAIVLIWQKNNCPFTAEVVPYISDLTSNSLYKDILFLWINGEQAADRDTITAQAKYLNIKEPILLDSSQAVTLNFNVSNSTETIVIDPSHWEIIYQGAIHDQINDNKQNTPIKNHYLKDTLNSLIEAQPIRPSETRLKTTPFTFKTNNLTYTQDIAPILQKKCTICHLPNGVAPFTFDHYTTVKGWSSMIHEVLLTKRMPPWGVDPIHKNLKHDLSISSDEVNTIVRWINQGMPRGKGNDPLQIPMAKLYDNENLGEPDIIIPFSEFDIPEKGILPYYFERLPLGNKEDLWVKAIKFIPSNFNSTHHVGAMMVPEHLNYKIKDNILYGKQKNSIYHYYIGSWTAGRNPLIQFPENSGYLIEKNSKIVAQRHYVTNGKKEKDTLNIGLYLNDKIPDTRVMWYHYSKYPLSILPGEKDAQFEILGKEFNYDIKIYAYKPHMHFRGTQMKASVIYPNNSREVLFSIPNYSYNWQYIYYLKEPITLPAGSKLYIENTFDNSEKNPSNPDPNQHVEYGQMDDSEMFVFGILYTMLDEKGNFHRIR